MRGCERIQRPPVWLVAGEELEQLPDRALATGQVGEREVVPDLVAVPAAVSPLHQVARTDEISDDPERRALRDAERRGDIA